MIENVVLTSTHSHILFYISLFKSPYANMGTYLNFPKSGNPRGIILIGYFSTIPPPLKNSPATKHLAETRKYIMYLNKRPDEQIHKYEKAHFRITHFFFRYFRVAGELWKRVTELFSTIPPPLNI